MTNSAEEIWGELGARFPGPLVVLEYWPAGDGDDHDRLDQVALEGRRPTWRRIWPTAPPTPTMTSAGHGCRRTGTTCSPSPNPPRRQRI